MKHLWYFLLFVFQCSSLLAQREPGILRVRFDDQHPLTIAVNEKRFPKVATSLTVGDLPPKRHTVDVYEFREYKDGGGQAKLMFSGRLKVRSGEVTYCIVERQTGRIKVYSREIAEDGSYWDPLFDVTTPKATPKQSSDRVVRSNLKEAQLKELEQEISSIISDEDKMAFLRDGLTEKSLTTAQLKTLLKGLGSETTRLEFAKWAYPNVSDPENFVDLFDLFVYDRSKEELRKLTHQTD